MNITIVLVIILVIIYAISFILTTLEVVFFYSSGYRPNFKDHVYNTGIIVTPIVNTIATVIIALDIYKHGWDRSYDK